MKVDHATLGGPELAPEPAPSTAGVHEAPSATRRPRADILVAVVPALVAAGLCSYGITARSLGFDEGASVAIAAQHGAALGRALAHDGGNMSGYYLLLHALTGLFGNGLLVLRLPSVVFAAATAGLVTLLAQTLFTTRAALISGLLTAVSLPLVFWGQSARGYAPMVALTCASYLAFASLVRRAEQGRPTRPVAIAYAIATGLAAYTSFVAVLVVPAQLLMLVRRRRAVRPVIQAVAFSALSWIPLVVLALSRGSGQLFWVPRPSLKIERQVLDALSSAGLDPSFHRTATTLALLVLTTVMLLAGAAVFAVRAARGQAKWSHGLVLSWLLVPVALAWLESLFGQPIFTPRNLLMAVAPVGVLLAVVVTDRHIPRLVGAALLAAVIALRLVQVTASYGVSPEDWKAASAYVMKRSSGLDCAVFYPSDGQMAFRYYLADARTAPLPILPPAAWSTVKPYVEDYASLTPAQLAGLPARCPRLWLISSHEGQPDGPAGSRRNRARFLRLRASLAGEYRQASLARFGYASPVRVELFMRR
jgi:mannosyltransferase